MFKKQKEKEVSQRCLTPMAQKEKGVTLIALAITIVVLLILAAVTIRLVIGDEGIINKAQDASESWEEAEQTEVEGRQSLVDEITNKSKVAVTYKTAKEQGVLSTTEHTAVKVGSSKVWIPAGYMIASDSGNTVDDGIVITDSATNGNEWVWVPVSDVTVLYSTTNAPVAITGGSGKTYISNVTASKYSKSGIISGITRGLPNNTASNREPDIVVGTNGTNYDGGQANRTTAGFTTLENMAQTMVDEYNEMIASIGKYGGFFIGRYELSSTIGVKKGEETFTGTSWYELYANCKELAKNNKAKSRMIWGCQWDAVCNWIATDSKYSITDSSSWGNYYNSTGNAAVTVSGTNKYGEKQVTGYSEYWKAKNIYDFAGNCYEWTQEVSSNFCRIGRGGSYIDNGDARPVSICVIYNPTYTDDEDNVRFSSYVNIVVNLKSEGNERRMRDRKIGDYKDFCENLLNLL